MPGCLCHSAGPDIDCRVISIIVLGIQIVLYNAQRITETLEMHHFTRPQEFERLTYIRIVDQAKQIVIGCARFLLCCVPGRATLLYHA